MVQAAQFPSKILTSTESLIIRAWRIIVSGRTGCRHLRQAFGSPDGVEILECSAHFLKELSHGSRRTLCVGDLSSQKITCDERQMLTLLAASQANCHALLRCHLDWLVKSNHHVNVTNAAHSLGRLLMQQGRHITIPATNAGRGSAVLEVVREKNYAR